MIPFGSNMMPRKPADSLPGPATPTATDLARPAAQAGASEDTAMALRTATDIARAIARHGASGDLPDGFTAHKVTLDLPDTPRRIQASLPHVLMDPDLRPRNETAGGESEAKTAPRAGRSTSEPPAVEIRSPDDLGLLIRRAREKRNQSQQNFADLAGVGRRFVSELENGKATLELGKVLKVMRAAGLSIFARNPP
jgi:y4mF family transcriptional regulator